MGSSSSSNENPGLEQKNLAISRFEALGESTDVRYGKHNLYLEKVVTNKGGRNKIVEKTIEFSTKEDKNQFFQKVKRRQELKSPYLCLIYGCFDTSPQSVCGQFYSTCFLYEFCPYDLETDLTQRMRLPNTNHEKVIIF